MFSLGNFAVVSRQQLLTEFRDREDRAFERGHEDGENFAKEQIRDLEDTIDEKVDELRQTNRKINKLKKEVVALEEDRDDVAEVAKMKVEAVNDQNMADMSLEVVKKREEKVKEREDNIGSEEESNYKKGYADGVADGLRKINEITQEDRKEMFKVAQISAASHTTLPVVQEINNAMQLTAGNEDKKVKQSS